MCATGKGRLRGAAYGGCQPSEMAFGHTAWFFETFVLKPFLPAYQEFDAQYNFVFNSYYETVGARVVRTDRGNLSRPAVEEVYRYRRHVDLGMESLLETRQLDSAVSAIIVLGLNHEQQHQELLYTDIKYILGHNPLLPVYNPRELFNQENGPEGLLTIKEGIKLI